MENILNTKIHSCKEGNIAVCGKHVGRYSTIFGEPHEITCKSCIKIIGRV